MATDNLNQAGKAIKKIKDNASYASKKVFIDRKIERSRDVFDTTVPFEMEFKSYHKKDRVTLDLKFTKPPPRKGCNADCFSNNCETFTFTDGLDHIVQLNSDYISGTVRVFRNRDLLSSIYYSEFSPEAGQVFVQGVSGTNEITVCYVTGDCILEPFDASRPLHYYEGTMTFGIPTDVGGFGYASWPSSGTTTIYSSNTGGATFIAGQQYIGAIGMIVGPTDCCFSMTLDPLFRYPPNGGLVFGIDGILGYAGTFTVPLTGGGVGQVSVKAQNTAGGSAHTGIVYWQFDPIGWVAPTPQSGQIVINDTPIPIGSNIFRVSYNFVLGTLHVYLNGVEVPVTENSNRTFIFVTQPTATDIITASYEAL